jgi:hypothetical protein
MHEIVVLRNRQLREIQHLLTVIDMPGQPDLRAGSVVNVNYPSSRELQSQTAASTRRYCRRAHPTIPVSIS